MSVVGEPLRMRILCVLFTESPLCVSEIALRSKIGVALASHHLQQLARADVLTRLRVGKHIHYRMKNGKLVNALQEFICS